jgi:hypothetical protein
MEITWKQSSMPESFPHPSSSPSSHSSFRLILLFLLFPIIFLLNLFIQLLLLKMAVFCVVAHGLLIATLMMEAASTAETSVDFYQTT